MPEEKNTIPEIHGHQIDPNGHHEVASFMQEHMDKKQVEQLAHTAQHSEYGAIFTAHVNGGDHQYRLASDGKIHKVE
ncbi:MAG: hypothetical protein AAB902_00220 [Patescibacteria group bacterium]